MNEQVLKTATRLGVTSTRSAVAADWFGPVEALTRFAPTQHVALDNEDAHEHADIRYGIRFGTIGLLIGLQVPSEFILPLPVSRVPNTPDWFAGLMNLRGALVPVFDLALLLGVGKKPGPSALVGNRSLFLVLDRGEYAAALKINGFPQALSRLQPIDEVPPVPAPLDACVHAALVEDGSAWLELDHVRLFEEISKRIAIGNDAR